MNAGRTLAAWLAAGALAGCGGGGMPVSATFNSRLEIADAPPVKRLLIYEGAERGAFNHDLHLGFAAALQQRLRQCGVAVELVEMTPVADGSAGEVEASLHEHQADVALVIQSQGGDIVNQGAEPSEMFFDLRVVELGRDRPRWRAKSQLAFHVQNSWEEDVESGIVFGTRIVDQLRDDRVLAGCPARLAWPAIVQGRAARRSAGGD